MDYTVSTQQLVILGINTYRLTTFQLIFSVFNLTSFTKNKGIGIGTPIYQPKPIFFNLQQESINNTKKTIYPQHHYLSFYVGFGILIRYF